MASFISSISFFAINITRIKGEKQAIKLIVISLFIFSIVYFQLSITTVFAITDPLAVPNNRFGIYIIAPTTEEASSAADMVNNFGDWGYITVLIESKDILSENTEVSVNKWQSFFDYLRMHHLIPLVRIATQPEGDYWKKPDDRIEQKWAEFLNKLNWPIKNRYVIIYNEPNQGAEWGGEADPANYANSLSKTIDALKAKSENFYALNAGFDASSPQQPPLYMDQEVFMQKMNETVPGIFNKLDGWVSHSYPNPGFTGLPDDIGRRTVRTWIWELQKLKQLDVSKQLPVFITETGWKHAEGIDHILSLPSSEIVAEYYKKAFETAWDNNRIVAVTPFLLNYQQRPFDHFSFKKITGEKQDPQILGVKYPQDATPSSDYLPPYATLQQMPKPKGLPVQENKANLVEGSIFHSIGVGETYNVNLVFKNTGQSIWNDRDQVKLVPIAGQQELEISTVEIPYDKKILPGEQYVFPISLHATRLGDYKVALNLFSGDTQFDTKPIEFSAEAKSPVVLAIKTKLKWKDSPEGEYALSIRNGDNIITTPINISSNGISAEIKQLSLLPDYGFEFTLQKPYYQPKTVNQRVLPGINTIDFGTLEPDIFSTIFNPVQLWQLLPFSN